MKLFNWNLISDAMNKLNIPLDSDIKRKYSYPLK